MFDKLEKYNSNGHFFFGKKDELNMVCNAPKNGIGVYIVYALKNGEIELVYIGSSGRIKQNGEVIVRKGGLFDRLVNGNQFDQPRKKSWKQKIITEGIDTLDIYWYETFNKKNSDIPVSVEGSIIQSFLTFTEDCPNGTRNFNCTN